MQNQSSTNSDMSPAAKKRALGVILFILLLDIIGLTILIPVAPFVAERYSTSALTVTLLSGIYAAAQFFSAPILGNISDRIGRRPVLLMSVLGSAFGYFLFGVGGALWVLFLARFIDGITAGNISTASAYIADVSTPQERTKNFALIGIAFGLGFILGPALASTVGLISIDAPAFAAGILSLVGAATVYFFLPESLPAAKRETKPFTLRNLNPLVSIGEIAQKPGMPLLLVIGLVFAFTFNGVNSVFSKYVQATFNADLQKIGLVFLFGGIVTAIVQGVLVQKVIKKFGDKTMTIVSLLGLGFGVLFVWLVPSYIWLFPTALLRNGLGGFFWATMGSMTASKVQPHEQGKLSGVTTALQGLGAVFGPLAAGFAYDSVMPGAPFWMATILFIVAAALTFGIQIARQTDKPQNPAYG